MKTPERAGMATSERAARQAARRERRAAVTDPDVVMAAAAALLAIHSWSVADMRRRLAKLGYSSAVVETVVGRLIELGYLDDQRYAQAWVASRDRSRPRGSTALRRELAQRGVEPAIIADVLAARTPAEQEGPATDDHAEDAASAELAAALRLLDNRRSALAREPDLRKRRQKGYALLARNGFDPGVCMDAISAFLVPDANADPG